MSVPIVPRHPPLLYRLAAGLAPGVAATLSPAARGVLRARRTSAAALHEWGRTARDPRRPVVVFHAASAGELRQAEPVIGRLQRRHPDWQVVTTWFSPSAEPVGATIGADLAGYFPWDTAAEVGAFLDAVAPTAILWCKHDLWPAAVLEARRRGIRLGLFAGTVRPGSSRLRWPVSALLRPAYGALDLVGAVSDEDAGALARLGVPPERIEVTGDPRYDAVLERLQGREPAPFSPGMLVAGSTWPADEEALLTAFPQVLEQLPGARLIIVPHRPSPDGWRRLCRLAASRGLPLPVSLESAGPEDRLVISRGVGGLAFDYARGGMAYVGGGFRRGGVHSVLEPAAWARPVLTGPEARDSRDARLLNQAEALVFIPRRRGAAVLEAWWVNWARDEAWRERAGRAARQTVEQGRGAADRSADLVARLVESATG